MQTCIRKVLTWVRKILTCSILINVVLKLDTVLVSFTSL